MRDRGGREPFFLRFAETSLVEHLAGLHVVGGENALDVVHHVENAVDDDAGGNERGALRRHPGDVGLRDVAAAAGPDRDRRALTAGRADHEAFGDDGGRNHFDREPRDRPQLFAGVRVVAVHLAHAAHHQLVVVADADDDRRAPARHLGAIGLPQLLAAVLVVGGDERLRGFGTPVVLVDEDAILVENGRPGAAVVVVQLADRRLPHELAAEVEGGEAVSAKGAEHQLAIGDCRRRRAAVLRIHVLDPIGRHERFPELLARRPAEREHRQLRAILPLGGQEDAVPPDDGGRMPAARHRALPLHTLGWGPPVGVFARLHDSLAGWPAPPRPVFGPFPLDLDHRDLGGIHGKRRGHGDGQGADQLFHAQYLSPSRLPESIARRRAAHFGGTRCGISPDVGALAGQALG